ncbi:hypothetical protein ACFX2B_024853 [Malus domestica]
MNDNNSELLPHSSSTQDSQQSLVHINAGQSISEIGTPSSSSISHSATLDTPHHHHSIPISSTSPLLPVHHSSQLEVILPISTHDNTNSKNSTSVLNSISQHPMVTRLKSGTIPRRNYAAYLATFPELHTLQLTEDEPFSGGGSPLLLKSLILPNHQVSGKLRAYHTGSKQCKKNMILCEHKELGN